MSTENLIDTFVEVKIPDSDAFYKVRETLTRIGKANTKTNTLNQTCYLLHKKGRYYICHFMELFALDRRPYTFTDEDRRRRNRIAYLLEEWGMLEVVDKSIFDDMCDMSELKVLKYDEKDDWTLRKLYTIGRRKRRRK